jgi:hypothetical protein
MLSVNALVDDDISDNTDKLKHQTANQQYVARRAEIVNTQANNSTKEDN